MGELLSEGLLGLFVDDLSVCDGLANPCYIGLDLTQIWQLVSLSREGVTDSLDSISDVIAVPEDDDVHRSLWRRKVIIIVIFLDVHVGLSFGGSEDQPSESFDVGLVDHTRNVLDVDGLGLFLHETSALAVTVVDAVSLAIHVTPHLLTKLALELRDHFTGHSENLKAVLEAGQGLLGVLKLGILLLDEALLLGDVLLDVIEEQVQGLLLVVLDSLELLKETIGINWWDHLNEIFLALVL